MGESALLAGWFYSAGVPIEARVEKLEYIRDGVERKAPYCDYEMSPVSDWNYGFCSDELELIQGEIGEYPFSVEHPPVRLRTKMAKVLWKEKNGARGGRRQRTAAVWMHKSADDGDAVGTQIE